MSASTVLRVKRRLEENPQDALVLVCKRIKTDPDTEVSPELFVLRGTVENQEVTEVNCIIPTRQTKLKSTHDVNDIIQKIRKERKEISSESRYEVVNLSRGLKDNNNQEELFDLVDLEQKESSEEKDVQFAYDLYVAAKQDFDISLLDNVVSIENYETELIFGSYRDNGRRASSSSEQESEDSNDENNWRNDYPDSDHSSIEEEDMIRAVEMCGLEDDLSSDEGEDKIYNEAVNLSNEDIKRYGAAYAKYKARVLAENPDLKSLVHRTAIAGIDEEYEGYKDDDDDGFAYGEEDNYIRERGDDSNDSNSEPELYEPD